MTCETLQQARIRAFEVRAAEDACAASCPEERGGQGAASEFVAEIESVQAAVGGAAHVSRLSSSGKRRARARRVRERYMAQVSGPAANGP